MKENLEKGPKTFRELMENARVYTLDPIVSFFFKNNDHINTAIFIKRHLNKNIGLIVKTAFKHLYQLCFRFTDPCDKC